MPAQILPKLHCFCYKNWFMMDQCRIPGDKITMFPLECPLDQVGGQGREGGKGEVSGRGV